MNRASYLLQSFQDRAKTRDTIDMKVLSSIEPHGREVARGVYGFVKNWLLDFSI
jgi:hypothetical protein